MKKILKKIVLHSLALALLMLPHAAAAQAVITEIMYDPAGTDSGHEWIEIYNSGPSAIPLTSWKLYESDAKHNIIGVSGNKSLAPQSFAVIAANAAKFQSDYPDFSGELFHSAFSLDNAGATIELCDASSTVVDSVSYDSSSGGLGDGNSLQRPPDDDAEFSPHVPTPGAAMLIDVIPAKVPKEKLPKTAVKKSKSNAAKSAPQISPRNSNSNSNTSAIIDPEASVEAAATSSQIAAAAATVADDNYWLLAAALVVVASGAIVVAKHRKKTEWDIVEETAEDV